MDAGEFKRWVAHQAAQDGPQTVGGKGTRVCTGCHEAKSEANFTWASGLGYFCKECSRKKLNAVQKHFQRRRTGARK